MKYLLFLLTAASLSLTAQPEKGPTILQPKYTRALVMGISAQQDSSLPALPANRQNAELFAAFLRSRGGGLLPSDHVQLITGEKATLAAFTTAIAWLEEESQLGDDIVVYLAGNAKLLPTDQGPKPHLFFADSPLALAGAGSIPLPKLYYLVQEISLKKNLRLSIVLDLHTASTTLEEEEIWLQWLQSFQHSASFGCSGETMTRIQKEDPMKEGFTPILLDALLGQADQNGDERIMPKELARQLRLQQKKVAKGFALLLLFPDKDSPIATVDSRHRFKNPSDKGATRFPSLIGNELSRLEDSLLTRADERSRSWYLDFLLTMKLGQLMKPSGRCSSDLYDSLLTQSQLRPLHSHLRRQLAAALQDETQQALNDYLRNDTRELKRRWNHSGNYADYPLYMARVLELLGETHFMYGIVQCKKYYFEGLSKRLDFEISRDSILLRTALQNQQRSLQFEPEAAFVLNEMGILRSLMQLDSAVEYYHQAIQLAPRWGIPFFNLATFYLDAGPLDSALLYATEAVDRMHLNAAAMAMLGSIEFKLKHYELAEEWLLRAVSIDPANGDFYYNLSCTKARQGAFPDAMKWLEHAFKNGYKDIEHLKGDEDLATLRALPEWKALMKKYFPDQIKD